MAVTIRSFRDRTVLVRAYQQLEQPGVVGKLSSVIGTSREATVKFLPPRWSGQVQRLIQSGIEHALNTAIATLAQEPNLSDSDQFHATLVSFCGATSGLLGLTGLAADLPLTSAVILRSVAGIARNEGEDLETLDARTACISVLAMGCGSIGEKVAKTDYYTVRLALADAMFDGVAEFSFRTLPTNAMVRLVPLVGIRFGALVSQKIPSQSLPLIGAFGGAAANAMLMRHFQRMAHGHFAIRRLERKYGVEAVMHEYEALNYG